MARVRGNGSIIQIEKGKPPSKCRKWELRVSVGMDAGTGKYKTATRRFSGTATGAKAALRDFIDEIEKGAVARRSSMRFAEYAEAWLAEREGAVAAGTTKKNRTHLACASRYIGKMNLSKISPKMLEEMYRKLTDGGGRTGRKLSGSYVNGIARTLHRLFKQAVKDGHLAVNPCDYAEAPAIDTEEKKALPFAVMKDLIDRLDPEEPSQFVARLILKTGMRRGEVHGLSYEDIDFERHQMAIVHSYDDSGNLKEPKTKKGKRIIPITASAEADIRARMARIEADFARVRERTGEAEPCTTPKTPLCCNELGERILPNSSSHWWARHRALYGLEGWTLHEMRHSYLSEMARRHTDVKVLQELAGHASFTTTMDIYTHVSMEDKRSAIENVDW